MNAIRPMTILGVLAALVLPLGSIAFGQDVESQPKEEATQNGLVSVTDLRCEDLINPLGVDTEPPKLSWRMGSSAHGAAQTA